MGPLEALFAGTLDFPSRGKSAPPAATKVFVIARAYGRKSPSSFERRIFDVPGVAHPENRVTQLEPPVGNVKVSCGWYRRGLKCPQNLGHFMERVPFKTSLIDIAQFGNRA